MGDIEETIKHIIHNLKEDSKSIERLEKINNSFSIGKSYHTLLQPEILNFNNRKEKLKNKNKKSTGKENIMIQECLRDESADQS